MNLRPIVRALGGDLYRNGTRANVPAPGHRPGDRSVSLMVHGDRVVIHSFGSADWREVRDDLRRRGLIDRDGRLAGARPASDRGFTPPKPDDLQRIAVAQRLWEEGRPGSGLVARHLAGRGLPWSPDWRDLLEHPRAPVSAYRPTGRVRPAMMAAVRDPLGAVTAVELTYLCPGGGPAIGLTLPRKTIGRVPAGSAVRLSPTAPQMLVAEGVVTTLSAMQALARPGWALMSAQNLARWRPPVGVTSVLIAADRGVVGEAAAVKLRDGLTEAGVEAAIRLPPQPWGDWNEAVVGLARERVKEGRGRAPERRGWASPPAGEPP